MTEYTTRLMMFILVEYSEVFHERCDQLDIITHMRTMVLEYAHQHLPLPKTTQLLVGFYIPAPWVAGHWVCLKICFFRAKCIFLGVSHMGHLP